jgi:chromosome segregation ATPase
MNHEEKLIRIEEELAKVTESIDEIKRGIKDINHWLLDLNNRVIVREIQNGEIKVDITDIYTRFKEVEKEMDLLKKAIWIGFGIITTLQFVIPPFLTMIWR